MPEKVYAVIWPLLEISSLKFLGANLQVEKLHRLQWNVMNEVPTSSHVQGGGREEDAPKVENTITFLLS